jgi:hypothetical protein
MLPLAEAARATGHRTAVVTNAETAPLIGELTLLPAGPTPAALTEESTDRCGGVGPDQPGPAAVEFFVGTRIDLTFDEALEQARSFGPDLIVAEAIDYVGPMVVAAALGVQAGVAVAISKPSEAGPAVRTVLDNPAYVAAAQAAADSIRQMPTPGQALDALIQRMPAAE